MVNPVVQLDPGVDLQTAIATLIKVAENVEIVRWIELPASVLAVLARARDPEFWGGLCTGPQERTWYVWGLEDEQLAYRPTVILFLPGAGGCSSVSISGMPVPFLLGRK